jgi:hypothetical protein
MQGLQVDARRRRFGTSLAPNTPAAPSSGCPFHRGDLVRVDIELLCQFSQRLFALHGGQSHLCFEGRCVVPAGSLAHRLSCAAAFFPLSKFVRPALKIAKKTKRYRCYLTDEEWVWIAPLMPKCTPPRAP